MLHKEKNGIARGVERNKTSQLRVNRNLNMKPENKKETDVIIVKGEKR